MRLIVNAEPDDYILAIRAAKWMIKQPASQKDAILSFNDDEGNKDFYIKRNRASISVVSIGRRVRAEAKKRKA